MSQVVTLQEAQKMVFHEKSGDLATHLKRKEEPFKKIKSIFKDYDLNTFVRYKTYRETELWIIDVFITFKHDNIEYRIIPSEMDYKSFTLTLVDKIYIPRYFDRFIEPKRITTTTDSDLINEWFNHLNKIEVEKQSLLNKMDRVIAKAYKELEPIKEYIKWANKDKTVGTAYLNNISLAIMVNKNNLYRASTNTVDDSALYLSMDVNPDIDMSVATFLKLADNKFTNK